MCYKCTLGFLITGLLFVVFCLFILFFLFVIDIFLVALLLYVAYTLAKGTNAVKIFFGFGMIYVFYFIINALELKLLSSILSKFINVGVIAIMIVFQQEIRKFLLYIGSNEFIKNKNWKSIFSFSNHFMLFRMDFLFSSTVCPTACH